MNADEAYTMLAADMAALAIWLFLVGTLLCIWALQEIGNRITSARVIESVAVIGILLLVSSPAVAIYSYTISQQEATHATDSL